MKVLLVTGGAGFIGSNFIRYFLKRNKNFIVVNIDKLTYTGNLDNLKDIEDSPRHHFIKGDICNYELVNYVLKRYRPDFIINFAAESHVERSISQPSLFGETNIMGTLTLLEGARYIWGKSGFRGNRFIQVSTDKVYGSADYYKSSRSHEYLLEESALMPDNPYSATKASADLMVRSFVNTYGLPAIITRCCNNYGPYQSKDNFIPSCITHAMNDIPVPVCGDSTYTSEWIHVIDHCVALIRVLFYGKPGEIYNIGTGEISTNMELARKVLKIMSKTDDLIRQVNNKSINDTGFALNTYKIRNSLNWSSKYNLDDGLRDTVKWFMENTTNQEVLKK